MRSSALVNTNTHKDTPSVTYAHTSYWQVTLVQCNIWLKNLGNWQLNGIAAFTHLHMCTMSNQTQHDKYVRTYVQFVTILLVFCSIITE